MVGRLVEQQGVLMLGHEQCHTDFGFLAAADDADFFVCLVPRLNIFPKILLMMNLSPQQESLVSDNEAFFFCLSTEKRR